MMSHGISSPTQLLSKLKVVHLRKTAGSTVPELVHSSTFSGLFLDSCQRLLWVSWDAMVELETLRGGSQIEFFSGSDAYEFLLRVATGLESRVLGETDILGQIKEAWRKAPESEFLDTLMPKILEDAKFVRSRYMEGLGGTSYGSLVRMLLGPSAKGSPTVILGAGLLAQAVAPYFLENDLLLVNRSFDKAYTLAEELLVKGARSCAALPSSQELSALEGAGLALICIPPDENCDAARRDALSKQASWVVHLGLRRGGEGVWKDMPRLLNLDDVFDLEKNQDETRKLQVNRALHACADRAKLRAMGNSVTIAHGWEDLAVFA